MLQGNRSESERSAKLAHARPTLIARLRLFGLLAVLGPLFAGLNGLVLESVAQVEVRFISAESTQPAPDVVVVERVVDRLVYVPVDNLSVAATSRPPDEGQEPFLSSLGAAGIGETTDDTMSEAAADNSESHTETASSPPLSPPIAVAVRPVVYAPAILSVAPEIDKAAEAASDDLTEPADGESEDVPADGPVVAAATPRPIIVHTMVWNGEQFVQSADITARPPDVEEAADEADVTAGEESEMVADDEELADASETEDELVEVAEADVTNATNEDLATDEPVQVMSADGPGGLEQLAVAVGEDEEAVAAGSSEQLELAVEASDAPEDVAEGSDESEHVAVEETPDEPNDDDATRARVQGTDVESTPSPTN